MPLSERAREWVADVALPGVWIVAVEPLSGGFVNENLLLTTATGDRYVLRRYLRPNAERTCAVEAALAEQVRRRVPVAEVVAAAPADGLLLSAFVPGLLVGDALAGGVDPGGLGTAVRRVFDAIGDVSFDATGWFGGGDLVPSGDELAGGLVGMVEGCLSRSVALSADERRSLVELAKHAQPMLSAGSDVARLAHCDFNPKNILVERVAGAWVVRAVLDWEFAMSGDPLMDVGNMRRFRADYPAAFNDGFADGFTDEELARADGWDLFALADLLTRGPASPLFEPVVAVVRRRLTEFEEGRR
jgi:hypothetical protein